MPHRLNWFASVALALVLTGPLAAQSAPQPSAPPGAPPPGSGSSRELEEYQRKTAQAAAACPIKADPALKDFGFVAPNTLVSAEATLLNPLPTDVRCVVSKPTCTCTTADMVGKVIPAGGSIKMPISMQTSGTTGEKTAAVQMIFKTADGANVPGVLEVKLRAVVSYPIFAFQVNPRSNGSNGQDFFINAFDFPNQVKGNVTVTTRDNKPFTIVAVDGKPPSLVGVAPGAPPATSYVVNYDLSGYDCKSMPKWLVIETDRPESPLIDLRVRHACTRVNPGFHVVQYYDNLGILPVGTPRDFVVQIETPTGVSISGINSSDPRVKVEYLGTTLQGDRLMVKGRVTALPSANGLVITPVSVVGMGPADPKRPPPPGTTPTDLVMQAAEYSLFFKAVPATTPAAAQNGANAPKASP